MHCLALFTNKHGKIIDPSSSNKPRNHGVVGFDLI